MAVSERRMGWRDDKKKRYMDGKTNIHMDGK
jgi:hypothetical protein